LNRKIYKFVVEGEGGFPFDMLRYDCCWPFKQTDVAKMCKEDYKQERNIQLQGMSFPTQERWKSFGWTIKEVIEL